jgi:hypothetical protein
MKHASRNYLIWISLFTLAAFSLFSCAAKNKSTRPEEKSAPTAASKGDQPRPEPKPEVKAEPKSEAKAEPKPEAKPAPRPSIQETTVAPPPVETGKPSAEPAAPAKPARTAVEPAKAAAPLAEPAKPSPTPAPPAQVAQESAQRTTEVALGQVNFRQGPSRSDKILRVLKKGTKLIVLEDKEDWLRVRLEDGAEGWVAKSVTLEGVQPPPAAPPKGQK